MDWHKAVKDYLECYEEDNQDNIHEFIDGLVPTYYWYILEETRKLEIYTKGIRPHQVGQPIYKILQEYIYEEYFEKFTEAYNEYVLTCEKCGNEYSIRSLEMGECDRCNEEE